MTSIIAYLRVSTKAQRQSGLGLEAQEAAVEDFCRRYGAKRIKTYTEAESGRKSDRYQVLREQLIKARKRRKLTQEELGERLGQPRGQVFVSKVETGTRQIDVIEFCDICKAIGVNPGTILRELMT